MALEASAQHFMPRSSRNQKNHVFSVTNCSLQSLRYRQPRGRLREFRMLSREWQDVMRSLPDGGFVPASIRPRERILRPASAKHRKLRVAGRGGRRPYRPSRMPRQVQLTNRANGGERMRTQAGARRPVRRINVSAWLLLTPGLLSVLLLAIVPVMLVARNSFAESDVYGAVIGGFTLEHYVTLTDTVYAKTIGYIVSNYIVAQTPQRQSLLLLLLIVPFWTDFLVRTFAWITLLGRGGPLLSFFNLFGLDLDSLVPSQTAVMLALIYAFLPTAVFPIYASMRGIDPSLREAATDLGAGWWQTHGRVIAPISLPGIIGAVLLTFVPTLGVFVIPVLLGGGKELLVGNLIVTLYTEFRNQPMGAALSMVVFALMRISLAIAALLLQLRKRRVA